MPVFLFFEGFCNILHQNADPEVLRFFIIVHFPSRNKTDIYVLFTGRSLAPFALNFHLFQYFKIFFNFF